MPKEVKRERESEVNRGKRERENGGAPCAHALHQTCCAEMNDIQKAVSARENQRSVKNQIKR